MKLALSRQFEGYIWHIVPAGENRLALELRAEDQLSVRFVVVDLLTMDQAAYESPEVDWWTSLVNMDGADLILKKFGDEQDPSKHTYYRLARYGTWQSMNVPETVSGEALFPQYYPAGTSDFDTVSSFLRSKGISSVAGIEYTEWRNFIVVGYYKANARLLDRYLLLLKGDGSDVFHDKIDQGMQGVVFESFFTFTDYLVFVKERKELNVYRA